MIVDDKLAEYKDNIEALQLIDKLEVYRWMISFGKKLQEVINIIIRETKNVE